MNGEEDRLDVAAARRSLGKLWGLDGAITRMELARALGLSEEYGGEHISKLENGKAGLSGPVEVAIRMMMAGARPHTWDNIIKPGYPKGPREK